MWDIFMITVIVILNMCKKNIIFARKRYKVLCRNTIK